MSMRGYLHFTKSSDWEAQCALLAQKPARGETGAAWVCYQRLDMMLLGGCLLRARDARLYLSLVSHSCKSLAVCPDTAPLDPLRAPQADVAILEEPEHLNWYHHGRRWTDKFAHVVGIIHTNYLDYAQREDGGELKAKALGLANQVVCRMHCHKVRASCGGALLPQVPWLKKG